MAVKCHDGRLLQPLFALCAFEAKFLDFVLGAEECFQVQLAFDAGKGILVDLCQRIEQQLAGIAQQSAQAFGGRLACIA